MFGTCVPQHNYYRDISASLSPHWSVSIVYVGEDEDERADESPATPYVHLFIRFTISIGG